MKLILSRKGFDSGYGGMASPILPDGRLLPLPIPATHDRHTLADLQTPGVDLANLLIDLSRGRHSLTTPIHLDPYLDRPLTTRPPDWRPALGQTGTAQSHLSGRAVGVGDVFLFFGWFRETERADGAWRYVPGAPNQHVLFGWLEIDEVLSIVRAREHCLATHPWISDHPHVATPSHYTDLRNTLYLGTARSRFTAESAFGGGLFPRFQQALSLTAPGQSRSVWSLPGWFMPDGKPPLSYHPRADRWQYDGERVRLRSAAKGQEFVLDSAYYPEADAWVSDLISNHATA